MPTLGIKARKCRRVRLSEPTPPSETHKSGLKFDLSRGWDTDCPPRLCQMDLKDPQKFHQRLVAWLMKQE